MSLPAHRSVTRARTDSQAVIKDKAWQRCRGRCEACRASLERADAEFDHIVPLAMEPGEEQLFELRNMQVLCGPCHATKSAEDLKALAKANRIRKREQEFQEHGRRLNWRERRNLRKQQRDDQDRAAYNSLLRPKESVG